MSGCEKQAGAGEEHDGSDDQPGFGVESATAVRGGTLNRLNHAARSTRSVLDMDRTDEEQEHSDAGDQAEGGTGRRAEPDHDAADDQDEWPGKWPGERQERERQEHTEHDRRCKRGPTGQPPWSLWSVARLFHRAPPSRSDSFTSGRAMSPSLPEKAFILLRAT